eukprot:g4162.t1 g4162   contig15:471547-472989(-)
MKSTLLLLASSCYASPPNASIGTSVFTRRRRRGDGSGTVACFILPSTDTSFPITSCLSVSRSRIDSSSSDGTEPKKPKERANVVPNVTHKKRMRRSEIDDLVRGIGLLPVQSTTSSKKTKKKQPMVKPNNAAPIKQSKPTMKKDLLEGLSSDISLNTQLDYCRNGHSALRSFLPPALVQQLKDELVPYATSHALSAWRQKVEVQLADSSDDYYRQNARTIAGKIGSIVECQEFIESLGMDPLSDLPFLQHFNTWRTEKSNTPTVRELCLSPYLAESASILMDVPTVRLYQDSLFHKRPGDGWTPWHSDARMAPFDTSNMITFWIPLQQVPKPEEGGTGLLFVDGSHSDFALPYWNGADDAEYDRLEVRYGGANDDGVSHHMPLNVGDVTVHNGWTLHCADAADLMEEDENRYAYAVTFVCGRAEVRENVLSDDSKGGSTPKGDKEDVWSFRSWVEEVKPRSEFSNPSVPIVWPLNKRDVE